MHVTRKPSRLTALVFLCLAAGDALARVEGVAGSLCDSPASCVAALDALSDRAPAANGGMGPVEQALAEAFGRVGAEAVPQLILRLADSDLRRAELASYMLGSIKPIDPRYLPQISAGLDRGLLWLPMALAGTGTTEAAAELVRRYLSAPRGSETAYFAAIKEMAALVAPIVVAKARCTDLCGAEFHLRMSQVMPLLGDSRAKAGFGLMEIAESSKDPAQVDETLGLIAALGTAASDLETRLIAFRTERPAHGRSVANALIGIGSRESGGIFADRLRGNASSLDLRDVAIAGLAAYDAGPALLPLLENPERSLRIGAARAIGMIGYEPAAPLLLERLDEEQDVRAVWSLIDALEMLRYAPSLPALTRLANGHWYPAVRRKAAAAAVNVRSGTTRPVISDRRAAIAAFFAYEEVGRDVASCSELPGDPKRPPSGSKLYRRDSEAHLQAIAFPDQEDVWLPDPSGPNGFRIEKKAVERIPDVAVRVEGGWLTGSDRGEWGGELVFAGDEGARVKIMDANVEDIYESGTSYLVVAGSGDRGQIHRLARDRTGIWTAKFWLSLPGAPRASLLTEAGDLVIDTVAGTVVVANGGEMRMAECGP